MKNIIEKITKNKWLVFVVIIIGVLIGFIIGKSTNQHINTSTNQQINTSTHQTWTCSMHPQIKQDKPGDCPICGMDLIPLQSMQAEGDDIDPNEIMMTESAAKLAEIQTLFVSKGTPQKSI
jgi:Cu(I)/Ag(I) efflux system membrane fusion protein